MTRWAKGRAEVDAALVAGHLQKITGAAASGEALLEKAARTLRSAAALVETDPDTAFILAYDAARHSGTALLAQQGLRPTTAGGHYAVETVLRAQFGDSYRAFGAMRRRRNELEYPTVPGDETPPAEARRAIADADALIEAARQILPMLGLY